MKTHLSFAAAFSVLVACLFTGALGCAAVEKDLEAIASDPNTVSTVEGLLSAAGSLLDQAISKASTGTLKVLAADPNGDVLERDIAAEIKAVKDALDGVTLPGKT